MKLIRNKKFLLASFLFFTLICATAGFISSAIDRILYDGITGMSNLLNGLAIIFGHLTSADIITSIIKNPISQKNNFAGWQIYYYVFAVTLLFVVLLLMYFFVKRIMYHNSGSSMIKFMKTFIIVCLILILLPTIFIETANIIGYVNDFLIWLFTGDNPLNNNSGVDTSQPFHNFSYSIITSGFQPDAFGKINIPAGWDQSQCPADFSAHYDYIITMLIFIIMIIAMFFLCISMVFRILEIFMFFILAPFCILFSVNDTDRMNERFFIWLKLTSARFLCIIGIVIGILTFTTVVPIIKNMPSSLGWNMSGPEIIAWTVISLFGGIGLVYGEQLLISQLIGYQTGMADGMRLMGAGRMVGGMAIGVGRMGFMGVKGITKMSVGGAKGTMGIKNLAQKKASKKKSEETWKNYMKRQAGEGKLQSYLNTKVGKWQNQKQEDNNLQNQVKE